MSAGYECQRFETVTLMSLMTPTMFVIVIWDG